jgi:thioesterase domain-containing protein/acyl carrier protein
LNTYGPTEATIVATVADLTVAKPGAQFDREVSIGKPVANTQVYILDRLNHVQPIGVPGELHIAGDGLARGYLNHPELTQLKFVANPFNPGSRMYKTGDLARWLDDGNLQYLGRMDTQVKIRGFRIELGEIETRLNQYPEIEDSVVIAQGEEGDRRLIAFYRANPTSADHLVQLPYDKLRGHLSRVLPEYMLPAAFVSLAAIPLSANGKVDRRALERMDVTITSGLEYVAPRYDTEGQLVEMWAEVLKLAPEKIGVNDNFFELGGHSLSAVQLMAKLNRRFKQLLPLAVMFTAPNIAALAKLIASENATSVDILVPIQPHGDAPPIFAVPGAGGNVLSLQPLSRMLGIQQPFYGLQAIGLDGKTLPLTSVEQTAKANVAALKKVQPLGPYGLIGHSYGGVVAYEMARILLEQEEEISFLILLDSIAPSVMQGQQATDEAGELFETCMAAANLYDLKIDNQLLKQWSNGENFQEVVALLNNRGLEINAEQFATLHRVYRANLLCYRTYTPSVLPRRIDVSLYVASLESQHRMLMPRGYGWNQLRPSPVHIYEVDANHFSILQKVHLPGLVSVLSAI